MTILSLPDPSQADKAINSEITLISDMKAIGHCCLFVKQSLAGPKTLHLVNFQTGTTAPISSEQYEGFSDSEIIVEPYIKTSLLSSTFIFNNRKTQPDSPLLVWISDDSSIDSYCPTIHEALKREYIVLKVKIKPQEKVNVKTLIEEVYNLSKKIAKDKLCRHLYLYAHGSVAGLAGLSSHLRTLGIFQGAVFCNPLTDLLDLWNENKHSDLGYGDLKDEANVDQLLDDSPYHSDSFHMVSNTLFMSTDHYLGYPALKIYCRMKHFVTAGSHVFWTNLFPPGLKSDSVALAYLWSVHCSRLARRTAN